ncbi:MAG TPA: hypothetical protein VFT50_11700 [Baekduia sp.]|nr:hypothetical protein [Baekduia sp.]
MSRTAAWIAALTATLAVGAAAAPTGAAPRRTAEHAPAQGTTRSVGVTSDFYDRDKLTVHVGDRVRWVWHPSGFALHDVYVHSGPERFHSPTQAAGTFLHRFKRAGRFKLYCTQHESMTMTITVKKAARR